MFVTFEGGAHFTGNMKGPANTSSNRNGVETLAEFYYVVWPIARKHRFYSYARIIDATLDPSCSRSSMGDTPCACETAF